jgi:serine O-acetyltransferase
MPAGVNSDDGRGGEFWRARRARHPPLLPAISADVLIAARYRSERHEFRSQLDLVLYAVRLALVSDAFLALVFYRLKAALQRRGVPVLPRLAHRLALVLGQVSIGDPVVVEPGVYVPHGQVVVDGIVEIDTGAILSPFVAIGLVAGNFNGPVLDRDVNVGTGAKILGPLRVGARATIGAGAVVLHDVPAETTVAGVPAADISGRVS